MKIHHINISETVRKSIEFEQTKSDDDALIGRSSGRLRSPSSVSRRKSVGPSSDNRDAGKNTNPVQNTGVSRSKRLKTRIRSKILKTETNEDSLTASLKVKTSTVELTVKKVASSLRHMKFHKVKATPATTSSSSFTTPAKVSRKRFRQRSSQNHKTTTKSTNSSALLITTTLAGTPKMVSLLFIQCVI